MDVMRVCARWALVCAAVMATAACRGTVESPLAPLRTTDVGNAADDSSTDDGAPRDAEPRDVPNDDATAADANRDATSTDRAPTDGPQPDAIGLDATTRDARVTDISWPDSGGPPQPGNLDVTLSVKEVANVGTTSYPITSIVPLPYSNYVNTSSFRLLDDAGGSVPAQFEVQTRHWGKDNSIRTLAVHFQATVAANGTARFHLRDDGANTAPASPVSVTESASAITLATTGLSIQVDRQPFAIHTPKGDLTAVFRAADNSTQNSFDAQNVRIDIEERGPMRAVLRAESPAQISGTVIRHGWALRIYVYAGKPFIQLDYQLQNSPKNEVFGRPMYFDSLELRLPTGVAATAASVRAENVTTNALDLEPGIIDTGAVAVTIRHFWEMWPNGISVDAAGNVTIELFPSWSARRWQNQLSSTGLYWLNDMQHVVKEVLIGFESNPGQAQTLARTFHLRPVATLPTRWIAATEAALDMGGVFPVQQRITTQDLRRPDYMSYTDPSYAWPLRFGFDNFGIDLYRKERPNQTGDFPHTVARFYLTENPSDYFWAEDAAMSELNIRPQWMAQYSYTNDFARLQLTENPYGSYSWRKFDGQYGGSQPPGYLAGSGLDAKPRDDQHGWFYHVEEGHTITGNLWMRDWYKFVGEFRKTRLNHRDPYPDMSARGLGHSISHALQAFRVTGDMELLSLVGTYFKDRVAPLTDPQLGGIKPRSDYPAEAVFQLGYLGHAIVTYLEELATLDPSAVNLLGGFVRWNMNYGNFGYYVPLTTRNNTSSLSAMTFGDPQAWYGVYAQDTAVLDHLDQFNRFGIGPGGERPATDLSRWSGHFCGRISAPALSLLRP